MPVVPKKIRRTTRRKVRKNVKKNFHKKRVDTVWRNPEFRSQLRSKADMVATQQESCPEVPEPQSTTLPPNSCNPTFDNSSFKIQSGPVDYRHKALAILHNHLGSLEVRFQRDVLELEEIYRRKYYRHLFVLRKALLEITTKHRDTKYDGKVLEPCKASFPHGSQDLGHINAIMKHLLADNHEKSSKPCKEFWLNVLLRADPIVRRMVHPRDLDILKHIRDIRTEALLPRADVSGQSGPSTGEPPLGFSITFQFGRNPYFSNRALHKRYVIDTEPDPNDYVTKSHRDVMQRGYDRHNADSEGSDEDTAGCTSNSSSFVRTSDKLLDYKGIQVASVKGSSIKWLVLDVNDRDNPTRRKSFFDFFDEINEKRYDYQQQIEKDFQIGSYFKNILIPRAYLIYRRKNLNEQEKKIDAHRRDLPCVSKRAKSASKSYVSSFQLKSQSKSDVTKNYDDVDDEIPFELSTQALNKLVNDADVKREVYRNNRITETGFEKSRMAKLMRRNKISEDTLLLRNLASDRGTNDVDEEVRFTPLVCAPSHVKGDVDVDDVVVTGNGKIRHDPIPLQSAGVQPTEESNPGLNKPPDSSEMQVPHSPSREKMAQVVNRLNHILKKGNLASAGVTQAYSGPIDPKETDVARIGKMLRYNEESDVMPSEPVRSRKGEDADDEFAWSDYSLPSMTRAYQQVEKEMKRRQKMEDGGVSDRVLSRDPSESPTDLTIPTCRHIKFQNVSPYPSDSEGDVDGAEGNTPSSESDGEDVMACTPSSSDSGEDVKKTMKGYRRKPEIRFRSNSSTNESIFGMKEPRPFPVSVGGWRQLKNDDAKKKRYGGYDSEAPPPCEESNCKQQ